MKAAGLPVRLLHFLNPQVGSNCGNISEGQELCLLYRPGCSKAYTVAPGDTCSNIISANPGLSPEVLLQLNPVLDCGNIQEGLVLCIMPGECLGQGVYVLQGSFTTLGHDWPGLFVHSETACCAPQVGLLSCTTQHACAFLDLSGKPL